MFLLDTFVKKVFVLVGFFALGAVIVIVPCAVVISKRPASCPNTKVVSNTKISNHETRTLSEKAWNASDYLTNQQYYESLTESYNFNQVDNLRLDRLSSPQLHPIHGKSVIYLRRQYHMPDLRGSATTLHWIDLQTNVNIQLTRPIWGKHDQQFYWIDDSTILFLSNRGSSGLNQIFQLTLPTNLSQSTNFIEPVQITDYPLSIDNLLVNRLATRLAFSCQVYPNLTINQTVERQEKEKASGRTIYQFDKLYIRHWDEYLTGTRHHPFHVPIERNSDGLFKLSSEPIDILFNIDSDSPTRPFGDAKTQWSFSVSGDSFAFTRQYDETSEVAWSTNLDIFTLDLATPGATIVCVSCDNIATDTDPYFSPTDDNILIYRSHQKPKYESDRFRVKIYNKLTRTITTLLDDWDRSIAGVTWSPDGKGVYLEFGEEAENMVYYVYDIFTNTSGEYLLQEGTSHNINPHPSESRTFVFTHDSILMPPNIYLYLSNGSKQALTDHNTALLAKVKMSTIVEKFSFAGALNETVWGWHVAPVTGINISAPLAFLIHGGPQSSWYNAWSYRWNFQSFTSQGYAAIAINFHGSDSYGQNFTDSIIANYGSLPFEDLQLGLTYALSRYPYIDPSRTAALGASYGGYMINWIAGHPEMSKRFNTLICHNGVFDSRAKGFATEELFFVEHDSGGYTPWENPDAFERYSPVNYVSNWTQPMLIIVGAHDYRVVETQGIGAFTALQRRNISSRLLYFPTENHWILNPLHSITWYEEVLGWMNKHNS